LLVDHINAHVQDEIDYLVEMEDIKWRQRAKRN
jgi:hypothetical protein